MSPSSPMSGDLFDIVGRLRRSANTASRFGQTDELMRLADEIVRWQARTRTELCRALGVASPTQLSWELMIDKVRTEHERAEAVPEGLLRAYREANRTTEELLDGVTKP